MRENRKGNSMLYKPTYKTEIPAAAIRTKKKGIEYATWTGRKNRKITAEIKVDEAGMEYVLVPVASWYARFTDSQGRHIQRNTKCTDKGAAQSVLNQWRGLAEKVKAGYLPPSEEHDHLSRRKANLESLKGEYINMLKQQGRSDAHTTHSARVIDWFLLRCGGLNVFDFNRAAVERYLAWLQEEGKSARTRNHHKGILYAFGRFLLSRGLVDGNPCADMSNADESVKVRNRRVLSEDEIVSLLDAAARRPLANFLNGNTGDVDLKKVKPSTIGRYKTMGKERALIYETLLITGARWGELRSVSVADCVLDSEPLHIRLKATATKNHKEDVLSLTHDLAGKLKKWIKESARMPKARLFNMQSSGLREFDKDLEYAEIKKETPKGTLDLHCLRHTCATRMARAGVPLQVTQRVMRHSSPMITAKYYTHLELLDSNNALESLPPFGMTVKAKKKAR